MQEPADEEAFRAQLRRISHFFDRLVDMVPAKHYVDDSREDAGPLKYLKKGAKLEAKQQRKEAAKKRKRENLDPDKQQSTLEVQVGSNYQELLPISLIQSHLLQSCVGVAFTVKPVCVVEAVMLVQREQALRRKGQHEQDEGAIAPSTGAQQQHVLPTEATAPSDLRFDVPTGAHKLPCKQ